MLTVQIQANTLQLQDRDLALLRGFFESRVMTAAHVAALFFNGSSEAAKKRLQKLKAAGFISERKRKVCEPAVLFLTAKSFAVLRNQGTLAEYPQLGSSTLDKRARVSNLTIQHELEVMDVKAAFHTAIRDTKIFTVAEFSTWPLLNQFEASRHGRGADVLVRPDSFIRIHEKEADGGVSEHTFFMELDRSSEPQDTLISRASSYLDYYKSGGFALKNGATRTEFKDFPFRVLMVFKTAERRNNTAERLLQNNPPIFTQVMLSTFEEVTMNPLGAIWMCPRDYREAVKGTPFDSEHRREQWGYKRQTERELLVERKVMKFKILAQDNND